MFFWDNRIFNCGATTISGVGATVGKVVNMEIAVAILFIIVRMLRTARKLFLFWKSWVCNEGRIWVLRVFVGGLCERFIIDTLGFCFQKSSWMFFVCSQRFVDRHNCASV